MNITIQGPRLGNSLECEPILWSLPEWFGIKDATQAYIRDTDDLPTFLAYDGQQALGFLTLRSHSSHSAEIQVMAVHRRAHGLGIGRALVREAERHLVQNGTEYLQVKTLGPSHPDISYARTRAFYAAVGFRPLEEYKDFWGNGTPCLVMVKSLIPMTRR